MKNLILITLLVIALASCSSSSGSVILEIQSTGIFSNDVRINNLQDYFDKIENPSAKGLVLMQNTEAEVQSLVDTMNIARQYNFKSISIISDTH